MILNMKKKQFLPIMWYYYRIFIRIYQFAILFPIIPVLSIISKKVTDIMLCIISDNIILKFVRYSWPEKAKLLSTGICARDVIYASAPVR